MLRVDVALLLVGLLGASAPAQLLYSPWSVSAPGIGLDKLQAADIDVDGWPEVVGVQFGTGIVGYPSSNYVSPFIPTLLIPLATPGVSITTVSVLLVTDFTGDGADDVLIEGTQSGSTPAWSLYENNVASGGFNGPLPSITIPWFWGPATSIKAVAGDVDGDGAADVARIKSGLGGIGGMSLAVFTSRTTPWGVLHAAPVLASNNGLLLGDFDGDGLDELCLLESVSAITTLTYHDRFENGAPTVTSLGGFPTGSGHVADMNGDGIDDVVLTGGGGGGLFANNFRITVVLGDVTTPLTTSSVSLVSIPRPQSQAIGCADFDGDGFGDVVYDAPLISTPSRIYVARGRASGFWFPTLLEYEAPGAINTLDAVMEDFDRDGDPDIFISSSGHRRFLRNSAFDFNSCPGSTGPLGFTVGAAFPGNPAFTYGLTGAPPNTTAVIGLSFGTGPGACAGALDLGTLILPWGPIGITQTDANGAAWVTTPVPFALAGTTLHAQWGVVDPQGGVTVSGTTFATSVKRTIHVFP